jgi:hypothetical protein
MQVEVYRKVETAEAITGQFWLEGVKGCYSLEPSRYTVFSSGPPCIEAETCLVPLPLSPHLGYVCPEVLKPPGPD